MSTTFLNFLFLFFYSSLVASAESLAEAFLRMARVNCNLFTSGSICEGQHHHDFVRVASVRELEGIGHSADLLKSQLLI